MRGVPRSLHPIARRINKNFATAESSVLTRKRTPAAAAMNALKHKIAQKTRAQTHTTLHLSTEKMAQIEAHKKISRQVNLIHSLN